MKHEIDLPDLPDGFEYLKSKYGTEIFRTLQYLDFYYCEDTKEVKRYGSVNDDDSAIGYLIVVPIKLKPENKKTPPTLLERIKAEYAEFDVVELGFDTNQILSIQNPFDKLPNDDFYPHVHAQSMKGFYRYVYERESNLFLLSTGAFSGTDGHPVAVLFSK